MVKVTEKLFDLTKVEYRLVILPPTGAAIDITNLIESCHHEELDGELSAKVKVRMKTLSVLMDGFISTSTLLKGWC